MHELSCNDTDSPACFLPSLASTNPQPDDIVDSLVEALRQTVAHPDTAFQTLAVEALNRVHAVKEAARRKFVAERRGLTAARLALIIQAVEIQFRFERGTLLGRRRTQRIAMARQLAMFLCRSLTSASYPIIAATFGRDYSTALHNCDLIRSPHDVAFRSFVNRLEREIARPTFATEAAA